MQNNTKSCRKIIKKCDVHCVKSVNKTIGTVDFSENITLIRASKKNCENATTTPKRWKGAIIALLYRCGCRENG